MIKRLIQLVLDQAAARRLEKEVGRSMGRVARQSESTMTRAFRRIGATIIAALSVRAVGRFARAMFRLGSGAEETASKFATVFGSERAAELDGFLDRFARMAGLTRTAGREMLANFGAVFQGAGIAADASADLSQQMVTLAADLQSFHDVPIAETFAAIRSGATGESEPLKRFGIVLRAVDVDQRALANSGKQSKNELTEQERVLARLELITEKAGVALGDLERTQGSTANRTRSLTTWFRQLQEDLAVGLLPVFRLAVIEIGNASGFFDGASAAVERFSQWIWDNLQAIRDWGVVVVRVAQGVGETARFLGRMIVNSFDVVGSSLAILFLHITENFRGMVNDAIEVLNKIPGVNIEFRVNEMTPAEFAAAERALMQDIAGDAGDMKAALDGLVEAYRNIGSAARDAASGQTEAANVPPPDPVVIPPPETQGGEDADEEDEGRFRRLLERTAAAQEAAREFREEELEALRQAVTPAAEEMTSALEGFFVSAATGFQAQGGMWAAAGEAAREAGAAIVSGLVAGRAEEQIAQGTAALAAGIWPPNPAALLAAGKHFAAAALFKAIPGVIRGGFGGGGGAGGASGGGALPRGALGTSVPGTGELPGSEVHIYMDALDPSNVRVQRMVLGAHQQAVDRFGPNVRVRVHSRTGA